jgi:hypothetical protein
MALIAIFCLSEIGQAPRGSTDFTRIMKFNIKAIERLPGI